MKKPLASLYNTMLANIISPAQIKFGLLFQQYLAEEAGKLNNRSKKKRGVIVHGR